VNPTLHWDIVPGADGVALALSGTIDESADFVALLGQLPPAKLVKIDLSQIERISSVGVRSWINFMDKLMLQDMQVTLENCSVAIVRQLGMITQFRGHGVVRSVFAPYYCADCNLEQLRLVDLSGDVTAQLRTPIACPSCGSELELDEEESLYTVLKE
jgi:anti-anti-sigma regulatory factor